MFIHGMPFKELLVMVFVAKILTILTLFQFFSVQIVPAYCQSLATPHKVLEVPNYCEGIVFDKDGYGYISHGNLVTKFSTDGNHEVWATLSSPNGHKILSDGTHLVCDDKYILHLSAKGAVLSKAVSESSGRPLHAPNDLTLDRVQDGIYFTDPADSNANHLTGTIHYANSDRITCRVAEQLAFPNGIVISQSGKTLLVAESQRNRILSYQILSPGKLGPVSIFSELPTRNLEAGQIDNQPDGICLDADGNLYVAHYGMRQVHVLSPAGKLLSSYDAGNLTASNVAFGGLAKNQLFITGGIGEERGKGALFRLDLSPHALNAHSKKAP